MSQLQNLSNIYPRNERRQPLTVAQRSVLTEIAKTGHVGTVPTKQKATIALLKRYEIIDQEGVMGRELRDFWLKEVHEQPYTREGWMHAAFNQLTRKQQVTLFGYVEGIVTADTRGSLRALQRRRLLESIQRERSIRVRLAPGVAEAWATWQTRPSDNDLLEASYQAEQPPLAPALSLPDLHPEIQEQCRKLHPGRLQMVYDLLVPDQPFSGQDMNQRILNYLGVCERTDRGRAVAEEIDEFWGDVA